MKEGERDSFALARRPLPPTGFLLYKELYNVAEYYYLNGVRCS